MARQDRLLQQDVHDPYFVKRRYRDPSVCATYEHIARRMGEAVHKAYKGELSVQYPEGEKYARVRWRRGEA